MIVVIGLSTTVEYGLRSIYETLVGRLSAIGLGGDLTQEDRYAAAVEQGYVDFIRVHPWYEFNFAERLRHLWSDTSLWGAHPLRKWERKYALTTEYAVKSVYASLIEVATHSAYDRPLLVTAVRISGLPDAWDEGLPDLKILETLDDGSLVATIPRYDAFARYASALAMRGVEFEEIAGNSGSILVSEVAPARPPASQGQDLLFAQPILTRPGTERRVLAIPVSQLSAELRRANASSVFVEHIFDY